MIAVAKGDRVRITQRHADWMRDKYPDADWKVHVDALRVGGTVIAITGISILIKLDAPAIYSDGTRMDDAVEFAPDLEAISTSPNDDLRGTR